MTAMTARSIVTEILKIDDASDLTKVETAVRRRHDELNARLLMDFEIGARVKWVSNKRRRGGMKRGEVIGHGPKRVKVRIEGEGEWLVPPSMLSRDD